MANLTANDSEGYNPGDGSSAMDRAFGERGTSAPDDARATASPAYGSDGPCGGVLARLAPRIGRAFNPAGKPLDPTAAERRAAFLARFRREPNETLPDGTQVFRARDRSEIRAGANPFHATREVAVAAVLGLTRTHPKIAVGKGLILVTLIQPPRRERQSIRAEVLRHLLVASTDGEFRASCERLAARDAEIRLAQRVMALRNVGTRESADRLKRRAVGVQVVEVRSR